jgi:photosystem II stability/assembly factor-like uncharacterized protein
MRLIAMLSAVALCGADIATTQSASVAFEFKAAPRPDSAGFITVPDRLTAWVGLVRTRDGGRTWQLAQPANGQAVDLLFDEAGSDDQTVFVTPLRGWLRVNDSTLQTDDGGRTWTRLPGGDMTSLAFKGRLGLMGRDSDYGVRIYKTSDAGRTWSECQTGSRGLWAPFGEGQIISSANSYAILQRDLDERSSISAVGQSFDGGCTWSVQSLPDPMERLTDIFFLDREHG